MDNLDARIAAAAEFGIISRNQILALGGTPKEIWGRLRRGSLVSIYRGVYAIAGVPLSWPSRLVAARAFLGERAVVSHRSAGAWLNLAGFEQGVLEFTLTSGSTRQVAGLHLHFSPLPRCDFRLRGPIAVTSVERTLIDLGSVVPAARVEEALESALFRGLTSFERVVRRLEEVRGPGRRGSRVLGRILDIRDPAKAPDQSIFETRFYVLLRQSLVARGAVNQLPVHDEMGFVARPDLVYPDIKVAVQPIGLRWHSGRERVKKDVAQHNRLVALGWVVFYVTWEDCTRRPRQTLKQLEELIKRRSS